MTKEAASSTLPSSKKTKSHAKATTAAKDVKTKQTNNASHRNSQKSPAEVELAMQRVVLHRRRLWDLHTSWRSSLFAMSCLVSAVSVHQASTWMKQCISNVKEVHVPARILLKASTVELSNVVLAIALAVFAFYYQRHPRSSRVGKFTSSLAVFASMVVGLYYRTNSGDGEDQEMFSSLSCLTTTDHTDKTSRRQFPVAVVYALIVMAARRFMKWGMDRADQNVSMVETLQKQLEEEEKGKSRKEDGLAEKSMNRSNKHKKKTN